MSASRRRGLVAGVAYGLVLVSLIVLGLALFRGPEPPDDARGQLREAIAADGTGQSPAAGRALLLAGACALAAGLTAALPDGHPLRRALARGNREGRCLR